MELDNLTTELEKYSELSKQQADLDLSKIRSKAEKRVKETNKRLDIILETVVRFKEDVEDIDISAMDKYSHRIYEEVNNTINSIERPEKINLRSLEKYSTETRTAFKKQDEVLIKYVKLLKGSKYVKRVKSLSKALQKLNSDLTKLERFILNEYTPSAGIENIALIIDDVFTNIDRLNENFDLITEKQELVISKDIEIDEITNQLIDIQSHPVKLQYQETKDEYTSFKREQENRFQNIRKALRKYENNLSKMKNKPDTTLLKEFLKDLTDTMATQSSIGAIKSLLEKILDELDNSALKLKKDRRDATREDIENLLQGELDQLWEKAKSLYNQREKLIQDLKDLDLENEEAKISSNLEAAKRDRNRIFEREMRDFMKLKETTHKILEEVSDKIRSTFDPDVNLESDLVVLPEWATLVE